MVSTRTARTKYIISARTDVFHKLATASDKIHVQIHAATKTGSAVVGDAGGGSSNQQYSKHISNVQARVD